MVAGVMIMGQYRYDYYTVNVESDAFSNHEEACDYAIREAKERAVTYRVPAEWSAWVKAEGYMLTIAVCRKTRR
jgi:hypothetical protein